MLLIETTVSKFVKYMNLWNKEYALNMVFLGQHGQHTAWIVGNVRITGIEIASGRVLCEFDNFDLQGANNVATRNTRRLNELLHESFSVDETPNASRVYGIMARQASRTLRVFPPIFADISLDAETEAEFRADARKRNPDITEEELSSTWEDLYNLVAQQRNKREEQEQRRGMTTKDAASEWERGVTGEKNETPDHDIESISVEEDKTQSVEIFFSYAHEDELLRDELEKHLRNLERQGLIATYHDREIGAGIEWDGEIDAHLNTADIILLLISPDFMASAYCWDVEVEKAMERHKAGEARVIPIILRAVDWKDTPFSKLQALPRDAKPVTSWGNQDEAFLSLSEGISLVVRELSGITEPKELNDRMGDLNELIHLTEQILHSVNNSLLENQKALVPFLQDQSNRDMSRVEMVLLYENQRDRGAFGNWMSLLANYAKNGEPPEVREISEEILQTMKFVHSLFYSQCPDLKRAIKQNIVEALDEERSQINSDQMKSMINSYLGMLRESVEKIGASLGKLLAIA